MRSKTQQSCVVQTNDGWKYIYMGTWIMNEIYQYEIYLF